MNPFKFHPLISYTLLIPVLLLFNRHVQAADIDAGKKIASTCLHCHEIKGNSKNPEVPSLVGQRALYTELQIKAYQSGKRDNSIMKNVVAKLNNKEIRDVSTYFASLQSEKAKPPTLTEKGESKIAMCTGCHGASAQGRGAFPKLASQHAEYLEKQLFDFKSGSRKGGPMNSIASSLSDQDIKEIADYLGSL